MKKGALLRFAVCLLVFTGCAGKKGETETDAATDAAAEVAEDARSTDARHDLEAGKGVQETCPPELDYGCPSINCDDELECTEDHYVAGTCHHDLLPGYCMFEATCFEAGETNPENPCEVCDPVQTHLKWSLLPHGAPCGIGGFCFKGGCCDAAANCQGKECGDDGCGGVCGICPSPCKCDLKGGICLCG